MVNESPRQETSRDNDSLEPKLWRAVTITLIGTVLLVIVLTLLGWWALAFPPLQREPVLTVRALRDLLALTIGAVAGAGGVVVLVVAYQRQSLAERTQSHTERVAEISQHHAERVAAETKADATERRVTDLYTQAVEQLGHTKAAVRLGGLYALERLGNNHPEHRQTITDVICAYLRMPYTSKNVDQQPASTPDDEAAPVPQELSEDFEQRQELQVRLTAQRLLQRHLRLRSPHRTATHWDEISIDLTDAQLIEIDFNGCRFSEGARFSGAEFTGFARFGGAQFAEDAEFSGAQFAGHAEFSGVQFSKSAEFSRAEFSGDAGFLEADFGGRAEFSDADFGGFATFAGANFGGFAAFFGTQFSKYAPFTGARFSCGTSFGGAQFNGWALFLAAQFRGNARFDEVQFGGAAEFGWARFSVGSEFAGARVADMARCHSWPDGWVAVRERGGGTHGRLERAPGRPNGSGTSTSTMHD